MTQATALRIITLGAAVGIFTTVTRRQGLWAFEVSSPRGRRYAGRGHKTRARAEKWASFFVRQELLSTWKRGGRNV